MRQPIRISWLCCYHPPPLSKARIGGLPRRWPIRGPFRGHFWPFSGPILGRKYPWPIRGPFRGHFWPISGPILGQKKKQPQPSSGRDCCILCLTWQAVCCCMRQRSPLNVNILRAVCHDESIQAVPELPHSQPKRVGVCSVLCGLVKPEVQEHCKLVVPRADSTGVCAGL